MKHIVAALAAAFLIGLPSIARASDGDAGFLRAGIGRIVDESGRKVILRGGVIESSETAAMAVLGAAGANSVRVMLDGGLFTDETSPGVFKESGMRVLDGILDEAERQNLWVILAMRSWADMPRGSEEDESAWEDQSRLERLIDVWKQIAGRCKDNPGVAAYDLIHDPDPPSASDYVSFIQYLSDELRKVDSVHMFIVEAPNAGAGLFDFVARVPLIYDTNIVYGVAEYEPAAFTRQGSTWKGRRMGVGLRWPGMRSEDVRIIGGGGSTATMGTHKKRPVKIEAIAPPEAEFVLPRLYVKGNGRARFENVSLVEVSVFGKKIQDSVVFADTFGRSHAEYLPVGWWTEPPDAQHSRLRSLTPGAGTLLLVGNGHLVSAQPFTGMDFSRLVRTAAGRRYRLTADVEVEDADDAGIAVDFLGAKKFLSDAAELSARFRKISGWVETAKFPVMLVDFGATRYAMNAGGTEWFGAVCESAEQEGLSWHSRGFVEDGPLAQAVKWGVVKSLLAKYSPQKSGLRPRQEGKKEYAVSIPKPPRNSGDGALDNRKKPAAAAGPAPAVDEPVTREEEAEAPEAISPEGSAALPAPDPSNPVPPPAGGAWFGAHCPEVPGEPQSVTSFGSVMQFMRRVKKLPAWVQVYHAWTTADGTWTAFPEAELSEIAAADATPLLMWEPFISPLLSQDLHSREFILAGHADTYLRTWADAARRFEKPILIRMTAENDKATQVYRKTVAAFRERGAANVSWMWSPLRFPWTDTDLARKTNWPGESDVDWIGVSLFGLTDNGEGGIVFSPEDLTGILKSYVDYGKPLCLTEIGGAAVEKQAAWWTEALGHVRANNWPAVQAVVLTETPKHWIRTPVGIRLRNDAAHAVSRQLADPFFHGADQR